MWLKNIIVTVISYQLGAYVDGPDRPCVHTTHTIWNIIYAAMKRAVTMVDERCLECFLLPFFPRRRGHQHLCFLVARKSEEDRNRPLYCQSFGVIYARAPAAHVRARSSTNHAGVALEHKIHLPVCPRALESAPVDLHATVCPSVRIRAHSVHTVYSCTRSIECSPRLVRPTKSSRPSLGCSASLSVLLRPHGRRKQPVCPSIRPTCIALRTVCTECTRHPLAERTSVRVVGLAAASHDLPPRLLSAAQVIAQKAILQPHALLLD